MSFEALIEKVKQAEGALEARERQGAADWRQFKSTWRAAWTPGRIVVAGLLSGFAIGRAQPLQHVSAASTLRLLSAVSGLFAINRADDAADQASDAAEAAQDAADGAQDAADGPPAPPSQSPHHRSPTHGASAHDVSRDGQARVSTPPASARAGRGASSDA